MRRSPQSHTLAVLRVMLGLGQKEMAEILERSKPTVQAIELGKLRLTEELAQRASAKTGISLEWLLDNDVNKPPVSTDGGDYTREVFENYQAASAMKKGPVIGSLAAAHAHRINVRRLSSLIFCAYKNRDVELCAYKLAKVFDDLEKRFGVTDKDREFVKAPKPKKNQNVEPADDLIGFYTAVKIEENKHGKLEIFTGRIPEPQDGELDDIGWDSDGQLKVSVIPKKKAR